jgi:hypothetical protein
MYFIFKKHVVEVASLLVGTGDFPGLKVARS